MKHITLWKKTMLLTGALALAIGVTACGSSNVPAAGEAETAGNTEVSESAKKEEAVISGTLSMSGSTSMEKLVKALQETYGERYPDVNVTAEFVGSSAGIEQMLSGAVDIGNSSRNLKDSELESGAVENIVAIDGIAVAVDTENTVENLTREQLIQIYTGEVTNWSELGGADQPIVVIGREAGSGTRGAFEEILGIEDSCAYASELDSTGAVMAKVSATPGAVGYVSLDALNDSVKAVSLEGVAATADNIKAGDYFLSRPFVMATNGPIEEQNEVVQSFFAYVYSEEGQAVAEQIGLISVN